MEEAPLQYLTIQDVLWIHQRVTGRPKPFQYSKLEDAANRQYLYGPSKGPIVHALNFYKGFRAVKPFGDADEEAAFLALVAFLKLNGRDFNLPDNEAKDWISRVASGAVQADEAIVKLSQNSEEHGITVSDALEAAAKAYPSLVQS